MDKTNIILKELIDIFAFENLLGSFSKLTGIPTAILDLKGEILASAGWQEICTGFHRKNPVTAARCLESDTVLAGKPAPGERYNMYRCRNGLVDVSVPINIENVHAGNLFIGQFLLETPAMEFFSGQADEFKFNRDLYLEALSKVPVFTMDQINTAIDFLTNLTAIIGNAGLDKKKLIELNRELEQRIQERTAELTYSYERLRALTEASFEGIVISENEVIKDANNNMAEMFGFQQISELAGMKITNLIAAEKREDIKNKILTGFESPYETLGLRRDGTIFPVEVHGRTFSYHGMLVRGTTIRDLTEQKKAEKEIQTLRGILPICSYCKKIRDDKGYWERVEIYIHKHSEADFSHGICPECMKKYYPDVTLKWD